MDKPNLKIDRPAFEIKAIPMNQDSKFRGFCALKFPYSEKVNEQIKKHPGVHFNKPRRKWICPKELVEENLLNVDVPIISLLPKDEQNINDLNHNNKLLALPYPPKKHQIGPILKAHRERSWLHSLDTGLGKTYCAIVGLILNDAKKTLISVPAKVTHQWQREIEKYWPEHPEIFTYKKTEDTGFLLSKMNNDSLIVIVSHKLLPKTLPSLRKLFKFDAFILDEADVIKNPKTQIAKVCHSFAKAYPRSFRLGLTATPIGDRAIDIFSILDFLWPGRFYNNWVASHYYYNYIKDDYDYEHLDELNPLRKDELYKRFGRMHSRVSVAEADLPALTIQTIPIITQRPDLQDFDFDFGLANNRKHEAVSPAEQTFQAHIASTGSTRLAAILDHMLPVEEGPEVILVYHRALCEALADRLGVPHIHGGIPPEKRKQYADWALANGQKYVCTMKSIGVGVDYLKDFPYVLMGELYWNPKTVIQAIGRFRRIGGTPTIIRTLIIENSLDEVQVMALLKKLTEEESVMKTGTGHESLANMLSEDEDDETWAANLLAIANSAPQRGNYDF